MAFGRLLGLRVKTCQRLDYFLRPARDGRSGGTNRGNILDPDSMVRKVEFSVDAYSFYRGHWNLEYFIENIEFSDMPCDWHEGTFASLIAPFPEDA